MANTAARVVIVASIRGVGTPVWADKHVMHRRFPQSATMMSRRSLASDSCDGIVSRSGWWSGANVESGRLWMIADREFGRGDRWWPRPSCHSESVRRGGHTTPGAVAKRRTSTEVSSCPTRRAVRFPRRSTRDRWSPLPWPAWPEASDESARSCTRRSGRRRSRPPLSTVAVARAVPRPTSGNSRRGTVSVACPPRPLWRIDLSRWSSRTRRTSRRCRDRPTRAGCC